MAKTTSVDEFAKKLGLGPDEFMRKIKSMKLGIKLGSQSDPISEDDVQTIRKAFASAQRRRMVRERNQSSNPVIRRRGRKGVPEKSGTPQEPTNVAKKAQPSASAEKSGASSSIQPRRASFKKETPRTSSKVAASTPKESSSKSKTSKASKASKTSKASNASKAPKKAQGAEKTPSRRSPLSSKGGSKGGIVIRRRPKEAIAPVLVEPEVVQEAPVVTTDPPADNTEAAQSRFGIKIRAGKDRKPFPAESKAEEVEASNEQKTKSEETVEAAQEKPKKGGFQIRRGPQRAVLKAKEISTGVRASKPSRSVIIPRHAKNLPTSRKSPSNIVGQIDESVIRERLAKDRKNFSPSQDRGRGGAESRPNAQIGDTNKTQADKGSLSQERKRRQVINPQNIYGNRARRPSFRTGRRRGKRRAKVTGERIQITRTALRKRVVHVNEDISVGNLAKEMGIKTSTVIKLLMELDVTVTANETINVEMAETIAEEFGFKIVDTGFHEEIHTKKEVENPDLMHTRAPVVTIMGHVDHGKTSLLDRIRKSDILSGEAGGITQHIGAHTVQVESGKIIFLDTPGHEAFTALRARGANVTDIVVLVVAADDGVMPQTAEAIDHARAAGVPIIVAINKIDKVGASSQRVKEALTEYEMVPEEWGGSTLFVEVSALEGTGVDELLETILLQSEILELQANPALPGRGVILEAYKDPGRGTVASLLVQSGTLKSGDIIVSGSSFGRVRTLLDDQGEPIESAGPSSPVEITGLSEMPSAGEVFFCAKDEKVAREFTEHVRERLLASRVQEREDPWEALKKTKTLNVLLKGDVQGSVEALSQALIKLKTDEVQVKLIRAAVGSITESDVQLALVSSSILVGFGVRPENRASVLAKREGVTFEQHSVIYDVIDMIKMAMTGLLDPLLVEAPLGQAQVREIFRVPKLGVIAGCYILEGKVVRNAKARVIRDKRVIYDNSRVVSLRRFKDDVKEVKAGFECGLSIANFGDIKVDDIIEIFEIKETPATL